MTKHPLPCARCREEVKVLQRPFRGRTLYKIQCTSFVCMCAPPPPKFAWSHDRVVEKWNREQKKMKRDAWKEVDQ